MKKKAKKKKATTRRRFALVRIIGALSAQTQPSITISNQTGNPQLHAAFDPAPITRFVDDFRLLRGRARAYRIPYTPGENPRDIARRFLARRRLSTWSLAPNPIPSRWTQWGWVNASATRAGSYELTRTGSTQPSLSLYRGRANRLAIRFYVSVDLRP